MNRKFSEVVSQISLPISAGKRPRAKPATGQKHIVAGLFAGIGGLERGLSTAGHSAAMLCEIDPAAKEVLRHRFPSTPLHADVCTLTSLPDETSLVVAGFPCQDLSQAGRTRGIEGSRSGLIGHVFRLIREQRTPWVLLENVPFMLQLSAGRAMEVITETFEHLGYKWAYRVVDARAFGLPQRRRRVYFIASLVGDPREVLFADDVGAKKELGGNGRSVASGFYWTEGIRGLGWAVDAVPTLKGGSTVGIPSAPAILLPDGRVVMPDIRDAERLQGFPANWTKSAELVARKGARWKLVGNAVSVPAARWIGRRLAKPGSVLELATKPLRDHKHWPTAAWNIGDGQFKVDASEWPSHASYKSLAAFLRYEPKLLSAKATAGFLKRTDRSALRFPEGFIPALREHLRRVQEDA